MITPEYLKKGDKVALIASARKVVMEEIAEAIKILEDAGLTPVLGKNIFSVDNQFAGTDEQRAADLQWAIDDKNIKAIIFARGGYGTMRIIDKINFKPFVSNPKWIVGFSDITVLHNHIWQNCKVSTLHATMLFSFLKNHEATQSLIDALFGNLKEYSFEHHKNNRQGECKGIICGGNLSLIYALSGSKSDIYLKDKILFLEDLDEQLYHIDRMMLQLKRSGKLSQLRGLVVGGMSDMKDNAVPYGKNAEEIIFDAVKEYKYPVSFNFPAGHIERNLALYLGKNACLKVGENGSALRY